MLPNEHLNKLEAGLRSGRIDRRTFVQLMAAAGISAAAACETADHDNEDLNGASTFGVGWMDLTIKEQRRFSAAQALLHPAMERPNLTVMTEARVLRLTLEGTTLTNPLILWPFLARN